MNDKNKSASFAQEISPWFPTSKLPDFRNDFVMANEALYNNNALTNTQSQSDGAKSNAPENLMQPPPHIRDPVIQESWLAKEREVVMAQVNKMEVQEQERTYDYDNTQTHTHQLTR